MELLSVHNPNGIKEYVFVYGIDKIQSPVIAESISVRCLYIADVAYSLRAGNSMG